ncbi:MAG: hypothetical protein CTY23_06115 [Methylomonas sp.]|nr:MAG: hypothetical protein CTY23_06115 [Methylomonas sp.]
MVLGLLMTCRLSMATDRSLTDTLLGEQIDHSALSPSTAAHDAATSCDERAGTTHSPASNANANASVSCRPADIQTGSKPSSPGAGHSPIQDQGRNERQTATPSSPVTDSYPAVDWHSELQDTLGYENYDQLAAAYMTIKALDQWVYVTLDDHGFGKDNRFTQALNGLSQAVNARLFGERQGLTQTAFEASTALKTDFDSKELQEFSRQAAAGNTEIDPTLLRVMRHLTIKNILYSLGIALGVFLLFKAIRFLWKQDLSG